MKPSFFNLPENITSQARNAIRVITLFSVASLSVLGFLVFQAARTPSSPQLWMIVIIVAIVITFMLTGLAVARGGRHERGIWLAFLPWLMLLVVIVGFVSGLGFVFMAVSVSIITLISGPTLPSRQATLLNIIGAVTAAIILLVDTFIPTNRIAIPGFDTFAAVIVGALVLVFGYTTLRQFRNYSLRAKMLGGFISVTLVTTAILGGFMITISRNNLQENLERELTDAVVERATRIGDLFNQQVNELTTLAINSGLQSAVEAKSQSYIGSADDIQNTLNERDAQWRAADAAGNDEDPLVKANLRNSAARELLEYQEIFPANVEVFVTDVYGGLAGTTNRTSDYYQADEGWWQAAYADGEGAVYISDPEFDESANALALQIALPIRNQYTGSIVGILRTTYAVTPLTTILSERVGQTGEADLYIPGEVVSHFHDGEYSPAKVEEFEALQAVADQGLVEMEFEGERSVVTQALVRTLAGNPVVDDLGWVVVLHQEQNEAFAPVNAQNQGFVVVLLVAVSLAVVAAYLVSQLLINPILHLTNTAEEISAGNLDSRAEVTTADEVGTLATAFNYMTSQLRDFIATLEQRVAERTQNLVLAAEVGRSVSQVRALEIMLEDACELIREQFDLYYVQVYLSNPGQTALQLRAGTGEVGEQLQAGGHSLPLNTSSINGRAAVERRSVVVADTMESAAFRPNPLLPETRGEMAVPLIAGDDVVGVLDMQSRYPGTLTPETLPAFEALAGQLAVAIQNTRLVAEAQEARAEVEAQSRRLVRSGWGEYMDAIHKPEQIGYAFDQSGITPLSEAQASQYPQDEQAISAPISLTGEALGSLVVETGEGSESEQTIELVNIVARQVAQQLENLRLLDSAERYRQEAEEAARRQTVEGWEEYIQSRTEDSLGFLYDRNKVQPQGNGKEAKDGLTLPLKAREEMVGKLSIEGLTPEDTDSIELASAVAERLGAQIESLRLFEETRRGQMELDKRARQLAAVAEVSTASSQEMDVDKMLATVVQLTQRQFGLYHAHIFTFNEATDELEIVACGWQAGDENEGTNETSIISLDQEQSLVAQAARTRQPVIVNDVKNEPGWLPNKLLPDTRSELAVPLMVGDQVLGVLDVQSDQLNAFSDEDTNIQMTLASQVAIALQNAYSFAQAQKQAERETMLNVISQKIQSATSVEAVLQIAARELGHALGAPMTIAQLSMKDKDKS